MERNNIQINRESLIQFLGTERFLMVDIRFVKLFNANGALFLTNLIDKYLFMKACGKLKDNGFFYTFEQQTEAIGLSLFELRGCKKKLIETGIIEIKKVGLPAKEYYFIQFNTLFELLNIGVRSVRQEVTLNGRTSDTVNGKDIIYTNLPYIDSAESPISLNLTPPKEKITLGLFDKFWNIYPRKEGKGDALSVWEKLCKKPSNERPTWVEVRKAVNLQTDSDQWQDPTFIPYAKTWLNNKKWMNDPATMKSHNREQKPKFVASKFMPPFKEISGRKFWLNENDGEYYQHGSNEKYVE